MKMKILILLATLFISKVMFSQTAQECCQKSIEFISDDGNIISRLDYLNSPCNKEYVCSSVAIQNLSVVITSQDNAVVNNKNKILNTVSHLKNIYRDSINATVAELDYILGVTHVFTNNNQAAKQSFENYLKMIRRSINKGEEISNISRRNYENVSSSILPAVKSDIEIEDYKKITFDNDKKGLRIGNVCSFIAGQILAGDSWWDVIFKNEFDIILVVEIVDNSFSEIEVQALVKDIKIDVNGSFQSYNMATGNLKEEYKSQFEKHIGKELIIPISQIKCN